MDPLLTGPSGAANGDLQVPGYGDDEIILSLFHYDDTVISKNTP